MYVRRLDSVILLREALCNRQLASADCTSSLKRHMTGTVRDM